MRFKEKTAYVLLLINIILNSAALFLILLMPMSAFHYTTNQILFLSIIIVIGLILLGFNEDFQNLLEKISIRNQRELFSHEKDYILSLVNNVANKINQKEDIHLVDLDSIKIKVDSNTGINAFIIGKRTLYVSEGFLYDKSLTDREREAILAHEFCHLLNYDSVFTFSIVSANFVMKILGFLCTLYMGAGKINTSSKGKNKGSILDIIIPITYFVFVKILSNGIYTISLRYYSRVVEYRCDRFSAELGYRNDLISFFYKLQKMENSYQNASNDSLLSILYNTHPKTVNRIVELEKANRNVVFN